MFSNCKDLFSSFFIDGNQKNTRKIRVHLNPAHNPYSGAKSNDSKWIKVRKFFIKVSIIAVIGYISRWYINDIFNVNVFVNYNHPLSITYYCFYNNKYY